MEALLGTRVLSCYSVRGGMGGIQDGAHGCPNLSPELPGPPGPRTPLPPCPPHEPVHKGSLWAQELEPKAWAMGMGGGQAPPGPSALPADPAQVPAVSTALDLRPQGRATPANFLMSVSTEVPFAFTTPPGDRYSDPCSN